MNVYNSDNTVSANTSQMYILLCRRRWNLSVFLYLALFRLIKDLKQRDWRRRWCEIGEVMLLGSSKMLKPTNYFQPFDTEIAYLERVLKGGNVQLNITQTGRYVGQTGRVTEKCRLD